MRNDADLLRDWYSRHARDLPWRRPGVTPWQILVSEVMLQQTPVARVAPVWLSWIQRWPDAPALAAGKRDEVIRAWGKLGYPRRALRLHECAIAVTTEHDGILPNDVSALLELPGIGAYTARAVACFAYGQRVPVVDINVRRVIARAIHGAADAGNPSTARDLKDVSALLPVDVSQAVQFSAALMELGATVCKSRNPECDSCPLSSCSWVAAGRPPAVAVRRAQKYEGSDRQARGRLLDVLRDSTFPVPGTDFDLAWPHDPGQRARALDSLLVEGFIEQLPDGRFALAR